MARGIMRWILLKPILSLNAAIRFPTFLRVSRSVELLMEELAVDPACNGDAAGLSQLFVQLTDELIRIRNRYAKLFRNFITRIKISPAIGKIPSFPDLWLIALPFYPQDSGRQPFSALCRYLSSLARSFHRLLTRRKYPLDGHSVWLFSISPPSHLTTDIFSAFVDYPNCKISMN